MEGLGPSQKCNHLLSPNDKFGCIFPQFLIGRKHGQSLEAVGCSFYGSMAKCYDFTGVVLSAFISCNDVGPIRNSCRVPVHYLSIIPDTAETTRTSLRETCSIFCISLSASNINNHTMTIQPIISICSSSILLKKSCNVAAKYNNPRSHYRVNNATPTSHFRLFYNAFY